MKKVLFLTNIPVPYRLAFFNELGKKVDLTVTFERRTAKTRDNDWLADKCETFNPIFMRGIHIGEDMAFCPEIIGIIKKGVFDFIIVGVDDTPTSIMAIEYMRLKKIHYCFSGDGGFIESESVLKYFVKKHIRSNGMLYFSPSKQADKVIVHYGAPADKIVRYHFTSLTEEDFIREEITLEDKKKYKSKIGCREEKMVLGVGRLVDFKAWETLPMLAEQLGEGVGVYLVGGTVKDSYYESIFKKYKLKNFHVIDFMKKEELKKWYKAADVFVFPSRHEVWGLVINEAMANGLPIVATNMCIAALELVENGKNGFIVAVDDIDQLKNAVSKVLSNELIIKEMKENNLSKIRNYVIKTMVEDYLEAIQ